MYGGNFVCMHYSAPGYFAQIFFVKKISGAGPAGAGLDPALRVEAAGLK
jgi:hypothetical protein